MSSTVGTRDRSRTRARIITGALRAFIEHGSGASIAAIADSARVSKGGLLYHFPSREALVLAVVRECTEQLRSAVHDAVDLSENRPGKLLRAYVRVLCSAEQDSTRDLIATPWTTLASVDSVDALLLADEARWDAAFARDGIDPVRSRIVRYAAERAAELALHDRHRCGELELMRERLLAMAEPEARR